VSTKNWLKIDNMSRGAVLIAHNNDRYDYYRMAVSTAKRVNKYLDLPVTLITDSNSISECDYTFDNLILVDPDKSNSRKKSKWINKGRYKVFDYSPYSDTIVLDTDYVVNSQQLLEVFKVDWDFTCHRDIRWLMENCTPEWMHPTTIPTLWATVLRFKKTRRAEQIFCTMEMVQNNYEHYANIYRFMPYMYRNDYALTIALKTANGHLSNPQDYFWWRLLHCSDKIKVYRDSDTKYTLRSVDQVTNKNWWMTIKDVDFHMLDKDNFLEIM
jgi:hypothetical protein